MVPISIITINFNNADGLEKTFASVFSQTFNDFEYLVIDGGSEDGSRRIIEKYAHKLSYSVCERDGGIYNAMNKGIAKATGQWLLFLNSGDILYEADTLKEIVPHLQHRGIAYGDLMIKEPSRSWIKKYDQPISIEYFQRDTLPHQGAFISREVFDLVGLYDESGILCSDWRFFLEAICRYSVPYTYLDRVVAVYDYTGISSQPGNAKRLTDEKNVILEREWAYVLSQHNEFKELERQYKLLANSKAVKAYLDFKKKIRL